jgi:photosystem II stability/assembly factor-like uncharacterized protein
MFTRRRLLSACIAVVAFLVAGCSSGGGKQAAPTTVSLSTTTAAATTTSRPGEAVSSSRLFPLFVGNGIGVVAGAVSGGCSSVYLTTDFDHWRDVTSRITSAPASGPCPYGWTSAWFVSPQDGWVLGRYGGATDTVLFHTIDAGQTWTQEPGGVTGSNGGSEVIGFANSQIGWRQQFALGASQPYTLELTTDAGSTWSLLGAVDEHGGCESAPVMFTNRNVGFATVPLTYNYPPDSLVLPKPWIWQTTDGGNTWKHLTLRPPAAFTSWSAFYGLPSFFVSVGVLPVAFVYGSQTAVGFYRSDDAGITWTHPIVVTTHSVLFPTDGAGGVCGNPTGVAGAFPVVAIAGPRTWWVIGTSRTGIRTISVTTNGGQSWTTVTPTGLPSYTPTIQEYASLEGFINTLYASSGTRAWITVTEGKTLGSQADQLLKTDDGGRTWSPLKVTTTP